MIWPKRPKNIEKMIFSLKSDEIFATNTTCTCLIKNWIDDFQLSKAHPIVAFRVSSSHRNPESTKMPIYSGHLSKVLLLQKQPSLLDSSRSQSNFIYVQKRRFHSFFSVPLLPKWTYLRFLLMFIVILLRN